MGGRSSGFSLVEVTIALMLLSVAVLGLQLMTGTALQRVRGSHVNLTAAQLAEDKLDAIRLEPIYGNLPSYAGTDVPVGFPNFERTTTITQRRDSTALGVTDYRIITVSVKGPQLQSPVKRTLVIGAP